LSGAVVIGGGPAGSAAAILLAGAGREVTLIERTAVPSDKVCGDFLSVEAVDAIVALGVDLAMLAPSPITHVRLVHGRSMAATRLPFPALGLTRRALDEALLQRAVLSGATVLRGHAVRGIERCGASLQVDGASLGRIGADTVFLATGKHDLRGAPRPARDTGLVGLKMYYALAPHQQEALRGHIELMLFAGGYAGIQLVEADHAVLCALVTRDRLRAAGGKWHTLLDGLTHECPHLADRLTGARPLLDRPMAVAGLPYGYVSEPEEPDLGLFRLGDQATVIASLTGDGVALALASAGLATRTWLAQGNAAPDYHRRWARRVDGQMRSASLIHRACLAPAAQPWLLRACRLWPGAMRVAASWTRTAAAIGV
jgi:menaquinone-9 beta-reductase